MFATSAYRIRVADGEDADALRLAERGGQQPLVGRTLIGYMSREPAAALSLRDGRVTADPRHRTDHLVAILRMRAGAIQAYEATPSLRERLQAAFAKARGDSIVEPVPMPHARHADQARPSDSEETIERKAA
jgi:hypothetical protein